jgi:hypothetical protein
VAARLAISPLIHGPSHESTGIFPAFIAALAQSSPIWQWPEIFPTVIVKLLVEEPFSFAGEQHSVIQFLLFSVCGSDEKLH